MSTAPAATTSRKSNVNAPNSCAYTTAANLQDVSVVIQNVVLGLSIVIAIKRGICNDAAVNNGLQNRFFCSFLACPMNSVANSTPNTIANTIRDTTT